MLQEYVGFPLEFLSGTKENNYLYSFNWLFQLDDETNQD